VTSLLPLSRIYEQATKGYWHLAADTANNMPPSRFTALLLELIEAKDIDGLAAFNAGASYAIFNEVK